MLSRVLLDDLDYRALAPGGYLAGGGPIGRFRVVSQQASAPVAVAGPRRGEAFGFPGPAGPGKSSMIKDHACGPKRQPLEAAPLSLRRGQQGGDSRTFTQERPSRSLTQVLKGPMPAPLNWREARSDRMTFSALTGFRRPGSGHARKLITAAIDPATPATVRAATVQGRPSGAVGRGAKPSVMRARTAS